MKLNSAIADIYIPDGAEERGAMSRTTHLAIGAHQDDLEIFAYHGIAECYERADKWFGGVTVTDGAGSARTGIYADYSDERMQEVRLAEQRKAARLGGYAFQIQLRYSSKQVKDPAERSVSDDLHAILLAAEPEIVYLHNPADKHDTHVATMLRALAALRRLPPGKRPKKVYGCEVWRDLDWMQDAEKQVLATDRYPDLAAALVSLYDSQISGGKRYDLATAGRRLANATYFASHDVDELQGMTFAMDLLPLVEDPRLSVKDYALSAIDRFRQDVAERIAKLEKTGR